VSRVIIIFLLP